MKKRRLVVTVKEGFRLADALGDNKGALKSRALYTSQNDTYFKLHDFPLDENNIQVDKDLHKEAYYNTLGKQAKEWYRTYTIDVDDDKEVEKLLEALQSSEAIVENYYEDGLIRFESHPEDPKFNEQRSLFSHLFIEEAWDLAPQLGAGILVSVIDTGVMVNHPDLASNLWRQQSGVIGFPADSKNMSDPTGHGTGVCGIISAISNQIGIIGIAPSASLQVHMLKVSGNEAFMSACIEAMIRSRDTKCRIVNCSFTVSTPIFRPAVKEFQNAINALSSQLLFVFSAGNDSIPTDSTFLTGLNNVLIAGALAPNDNRASYSNPGKNVVYAYGDIISTSLNNEYGIFRLTSAAAPQLTGICTLLLSVQSLLSPVQIKTIIENTTNPLPFVPKSAGIGKVNAKRALERVINDFGLA